MVKYKTTRLGIEVIEVASETKRSVTYYDPVKQRIITEHRASKHHCWHETWQVAIDHVVEWARLELRTVELEVQRRKERLDDLLALEEPSVKKEEDYA